MPGDIAGSIEALALVRLIATSSWLYPVISALHILGIAMLVGPIVLADLRLLRLLGPQFDPVMPALQRTALAGFALAAVSGLLLASVQVSSYATNPFFLAKMLILLAAGANALWLAMGGAPRIAGLLSLLLWLGAILAGRWIGFA